MEVGKGRAKTGWVFAKYLAKQAEETSPVVEHEEFPWMSIAVSEIGQKEVPGTGNNPRVIEYLESTDLDAVSASKDSTFWCSAFVNWCVEKAGYAGSNADRSERCLCLGPVVAPLGQGCGEAAPWLHRGLQ